ncbi:hypothetical protein C1N62_05100 [Nissabacter sp. SGAir0207]|nr:hypothetical protein C1N62_05100 [Nissabacter sp. SGAir0207]
MVASEGGEGGDGLLLCFAQAGRVLAGVELACQILLAAGGEAGTGGSGQCVALLPFSQHGACHCVADSLLSCKNTLCPQCGLGLGSSSGAALIQSYFSE